MHRSSHRGGLPGARALGVALAALLTLDGCYTWTPVSQESLRAGTVEVRTRRVRFDGESDELVVHRVNSNYVEGWDERLGAERRIDVSRPWVRIEVRRPDRRATAAAIVGGSLAAIPIIFLLVLVGAGSTR